MKCVVIQVLNLLNNMKIYLMLFVATFYLLSSAGCMSVALTVEEFDKPVSLTGNINKNYTIVKHFSCDLKAWFAFFDLVTISEPNMQDALHNEILSAQGDAVINLKIKEETTFVDGVISSAVGIAGALAVGYVGVSLSHLIDTRTYTIEGDVIKYVE